MNLWRISNYPSLSGEGGLKYSARWHNAGRPIVYLAESPAGAMLEVLIHLELEEDDLPLAYTLLKIAAPNVEIATITPNQDPWKQDLDITRSLGDAWLLRQETALARVPSAILPDTFNYLLNPTHPAASQCSVVEAQHALFDSRLLCHLRGG